MDDKESTIGGFQKFAKQESMRHLSIYVSTQISTNLEITSINRNRRQILLQTVLNYFTFGMNIKKYDVYKTSIITLILSDHILFYKIGGKL